MERLFTLTLAVAVLGTWLVPNSANAGFLQRLFACRTGGGSAVAQPAPAETGEYRRGSYEPTVGGERSSPTYPSYRSYEPKKYPWEYSKMDSRRFSG